MKTNLTFAMLLSAALLTNLQAQETIRQCSGTSPTTISITLKVCLASSSSLMEVVLTGRLSRGCKRDS